MPSPRYSFCIPTINRPQELKELFESILVQSFKDYEVVVCEDCSKPSIREELRKIAEVFNTRLERRLRFIENEKNLGYDRNLRKTIDNATGEYVVLMGDDDVLAPDALTKIEGILKRHPDVGYVMRSYSTFVTRPEEVVQVHRYYPKEMRFEPGKKAIVPLFHRSVLVSGLVIHRESALKYRTEKVDGTLYYQLYIISMILSQMPCVSTPEILVYNRLIGPEKTVFGNSESEKGKWEPGTRTIVSSTYQMEQYLRVGQEVEQDSGLSVYKGIRDEISKYSYSTLSYHGDKSGYEFLKYAYKLFCMGFGREPYFYIYAVGLLLLGPKRCSQLIDSIKNRLGHTPRL
jgi:abequosyltransferase